MAEDGVRPVCVRACVLVLCLLGAECWAEWGSEGVLIDFGHTSLLLKIPWLLLFCSPSPSFCLASSNETPNELEHVLTALFLPSARSLASVVPRPFCLAFALPVFVSSLVLSWFLYCSPSSSPSLSLSLFLRLSFFISCFHALYHFCHTFSPCALLAYFVCLSVDLFSWLPHFLLSPFYSSHSGFTSFFSSSLLILIWGRECAMEMLPTGSR